jgi:23S rRNA pseudouridine2605 synthase
MNQRIQKIISSSGICSRRKAEEFIKQGKVEVNNKIIKIGDKADPNKDKICIEKKQIKIEKKVYYILNKPKGILVTAYDPQNRETIFSLDSVKKIKERVFPVGRLDAMSEGILILTNDGEFANNIMHPRYNVEKTYHIRCEPKLNLEDKKKLEQGIIIDDKKTMPSKIKELEKNEFTITIHEGKNRIVRKMLEKLNYKIYMLKRISIGPIELGNIKTGEITRINVERMK